MLETALITKIYKSDKNKDDVEFKISKGANKGKKFWKVAIQVDKFPDEWFSSLAFSQDDKVYNLKEGDEEMFVFERGDYNNFKLPKREDLLEARIEVLEEWKRTMER